MANYNVVETTNMWGSKCLSFQATSDIENGMLVGNRYLYCFRSYYF